jgi:hypothetical protein
VALPAVMLFKDRNKPVAGIEANTTPNATRNNANQRIFPNGRAGSV